MKIALCLLTRNELPCLKIILPQIPLASANAGYDMIFAIDGGSTDGTVEFFAENKIPVVAQSKRGRGDAFLQAFAKIDGCWVAGVDVQPIYVDARYLGGFPFL